MIERLAGLSRWIVLAILSAHVLLVAAVVAARMRYPFELEWLEGVSLQQVGRLLAGQPLYAPPTLEFAAANYPPLYPAAAALAARVLGATLPTLRLVSVLATLACAIAIGRMLLRAGAGAFAAAVAIGCFAALWGPGGHWFDIARADMLFLALSLMALASAGRGDRPVRGGILCGALAGLAFLTKQSALPMLLPMFAVMLVRDRRRGVAALLTVAGVAGGATAWLDAASGGWYRFYVFGVALGHHAQAAAFPGIVRTALAPLAPLLALIVTGLMAPAGARAPRPPATVLAWAAGAILTALWLRSYPNGYRNVEVPMHAALALLAGFAWAGIAAWTRTLDRTRAAWVTMVVAAVLGLQLGRLLDDPRPQIPTHADQAAGRALVARLAAVNGEVFVPSHPYLAERAGRQGSTSLMTWADLLEGAPRPVADSLARALDRAIAERRFAAIVLTGGEPYRDQVTAAYGEGEPVFTNPDVFWPVTGHRSRPDRIYLRKQEPTDNPH